MTNTNKRAWISAGYDLFAKEGPKGLKVEVIARAVKKSKSSFYHYFADVEVFTEILLKHHLQRVEVIVEKEKLCQNIDPELLFLLVEFKCDLLFNRQLRFNRANLAFRECFERTNKMMDASLQQILAKELGFPGNISLASDTLGLILENFYLQITEDTLNYEWLSSYFQQIRSTINHLRNA